MKKIVLLDRSKLLGFRLDGTTKLSAKAGNKAGNKIGSKVR